MTASTITLQDGSTYEGTLSYSEYKLWIGISDLSIIQAATIFSDSSKTGVITYLAKAYSGFTELVALFVRETGIKICLQGGSLDDIDEIEESDDTNAETPVEEPEEPSEEESEEDVTE